MLDHVEHTSIFLGEFVIHSIASLRRRNDRNSMEISPGILIRSTVNLSASAVRGIKSQSQINKMYTVRLDQGNKINTSLVSSCCDRERGEQGGFFDRLVNGSLLMKKTKPC